MNVNSRELEVYRNPVEDSSATYGRSDGSVRRLRAGESVTPLEAPEAEISVADLLP